MSIYLVVSKSTGKVVFALWNPEEARAYDENPGYLVYTIPYVHVGIWLETDDV